MIDNKRIVIEIYNGVKDLDILKDKNLDELEDLSLVIFKRVSLKFLKKYKNLKRISFNGSAIKDYSILSECLQLEHLSISGSNIKNIDFINTLKIKSLNLELITAKEIKDLSFLSKISTIESLTLYDVNVRELTDFSKLENLKNISICNCKNLLGISEVQSAKSLEVLQVTYDKNTGKNKFNIKNEIATMLEKLPNLRKLIIGNMVYEEINYKKIIEELTN